MNIPRCAKSANYHSMVHDVSLGNGRIFSTPISCVLTSTAERPFHQIQYKNSRTMRGFCLPLLWFPVLSLFLHLCHFSLGRSTGQNLDWICEDAAPCVRAISPHGGAAVVGSNGEDYVLEIGVRRRQSEQADLTRKWSALRYETTWSVKIEWYRLLETKMRVPLPACRDKLRCKVSLRPDNDQPVRGDTSSGDYVYHHFLVEVSFEGHPSKSHLELVVRKDSNPGPVRQEEKNFYGNQAYNTIDDVGNTDDVKKHPKYDWLFNRKTSSSSNDVSSNDVETAHYSARDDEYHATSRDRSDDMEIQKFDNIDWDDVTVYNDHGGNDAIMYSGDTLNKPKSITHKDSDRVLTTGEIVLTTILLIIVLVFLSTLCYKKIKQRRRKRERNEDLSNNGSKSKRRRSFIERFRNKHGYQPIPSQGAGKRGKKKFERLNSDATDDEEIFPNERMGFLDGEEKQSRGYRDRLSGFKDKTEEFKTRASNAYASARRRSGVIKDDVKKLVERNRIIPFLSRVWSWFVAFITKCCGEKRQESNDENHTTVTIGRNSPAPSSGKTKSVSPNADIGGRFYLSKNRDDVMPTSSTGKSSSVHSPKQTCGLHCLQRHHSDSSTSSTTSEGASASPSVTSIGSDVTGGMNHCAKGPTVSARTSPPLPKVLNETRTNYRRENRRLQALLRNWEKKSGKRDATSTSHNVTIGNRVMSCAYSDRFLGIRGDVEDGVCPPKLLTRKKRTSRTLQANSDKGVDSDASHASNRVKRTFNKLKEKSAQEMHTSQAITSPTPDQSTSGDDAFEMTSQECDVADASLASKALRSAAQSFMASDDDDDDVIVASDNKFWKETMENC